METQRHRVPAPCLCASVSSCSCKCPTVERTYVTSTEGERMADRNEQRLSRRQWVGIMSAPALAAAISAVPARAAEANRSEADLGIRVYNIRDFGAKGDG